MFLTGPSAEIASSMTKAIIWLLRRCFSRRTAQRHATPGILCDAEPLASRWQYMMYTYQRKVNVLVMAGLISMSGHRKMVIYLMGLFLRNYKYLAIGVLALLFVCIGCNDSSTRMDVTIPNNFVGVAIVRFGRPNGVTVNPVHGTFSYSISSLWYSRRKKVKPAI